MICTVRGFSIVSEAIHVVFGIQVKKQQLELNMEQQTGSKLGKEYLKTVYYHPVYLTYMHSTPYEMLRWMTQAGIKIAMRNINNLRYADNITLMAESKEELKSLLMKVKRRDMKKMAETQQLKN